MKVPLRYQVTRNDCGPTSMTNALSYLLAREEFPPDVLEQVYGVMLDKYRGPAHPGGTSCWAMRFFGHWLNDTHRTTGLPVEARQLRGDAVQIGDGTPFISCVEAGGCAVMSCFLAGSDHYVLVTGVNRDAQGTIASFSIFDPWYVQSEKDLVDEGFPERYQGLIKIVEGHPFSYNRVVDRRVICSNMMVSYSLTCHTPREVLLLRRTDDAAAAAGQPQLGGSNS